MLTTTAARATTFADPGDPLEVDDIIEPRTVVDVERRHPQRSLRPLTPRPTSLRRWPGGELD